MNKQDFINEITANCWVATQTPSKAAPHPEHPRHSAHVDGVTASSAIATAFKVGRGKRLKQDQRAGVVGQLFGMLQNYRRLELALQQGQNEDSALASGVELALDMVRAYRVIEHEMTVEEAKEENPGVDWAAVERVDAVIAKTPDPIQRFALRYSFPDFLAARLLQEFGPDTEKLSQALAKRPPITLRVNTLKIARDQIIEALKRERLSARPSRYTENALLLKEHLNIFELPAFELGMIEAQDEASQLVAELVAPPPGGLVVDFCAGAGGKTLALAALMKNKGKLLALDINAKRLDELRKRARRAGAHDIQTIALSAMSRIQRKPWAGVELDAQAGLDFIPVDALDWIEKADRVLADVPCSGLGALRRKPEPRRRLDAETLERLPHEQEQLAKRALAFVKPGGRLIYSTCTILRSENEEVVERLLQGGGLELVAPKEILGKERAELICDPQGRYMKLLPHTHFTDGFFAAVLRKKK